ncbi:hypothetical protein JYU34_012295 [Plutella xylostella]|uniref:Peptidase S1 domain-containing protein n=1 Tax=Plutella xylostella TaxID=51655 RepID=A0ABQ7QET6_PLUXY|nr:hypothetical protein JYU34_012295 [Plutella xylostella]
MMFSTTSAFIMITLAATATAIEDVGVYIIGGKDASVNKYPSIAQMEERYGGKWKFKCGAVILSERTVITAAHCMLITYSNGNYDDVKPRNIRIRAGSSKYEKGGHIVDVRNYQSHPNFDEANFNANIALLTLRTRLPMSNVTKPAFIVPSGLELPNNHAVQVAGWGRTDSSNHSEDLQEVTVYTVKHDECSRLHGGRITENMICAHDGPPYRRGQKNACYKGDSGGPLYMHGMLVGIVSSGSKNCTEQPAVYTKVSAFTNWINTNAV